MASSHNVSHPFHLVPLSPWPIATSFALLVLAIGGLGTLHPTSWGYWVLGAGFASVIGCMAAWWCDVVKEARVDHAHTSAVQHGLRFGMVLFILSEMMFFVAFFWSFFKAWLAPANGLDGVWATVPSPWPPSGIVPFDPWHLPLMNTLILLLSGCSVTWAHYAVLENNRKDLVHGLGWTVFLGVCFTALQVVEYLHAPFKFTDGVYASNFYMATGFHGFHVLVGTIFLAVCWFRARAGHFTPESHLGFEFAAWYWHFVDVVWLFLYIFVYVFGRFSVSG